MVGGKPLGEAERRTILIADDERPLARAIGAMLDKEGLRTVIVHNGDEALQVAQEMQPDLVLLDVMMPGRSGIEVCATLKTNPETRPIPVIMLTAKAEKTDRMVGMAAGADEYLVKPFSPTELIDLVNKVLAGRPIVPRHRQHPAPGVSADQLEVYARELRELYEEEQRKREALEAAHERLEELDRLKAAFIGAVTNELMSPFASVGLALEVLLRQKETLLPEQQQALEDLAQAVAGLHQRVGGVVKFADLVGKRRDPQMGYYTLDQVIPWAVQPVAVLAETREVDLRVFVPSDLPAVHADPELLGEAVFQMAHNAVKFNYPGGRARVEAMRSEEWVLVQVTDTGVGLTPAQIELLRRPFEENVDHLRRGESGLGIGWTFVAYVAEVHGGWTRVTSGGPGQGSCFSLALPQAVKDQR